MSVGIKKSQDPAFKAIIMDHYKKPRFFAKPELIRYQAEEHNRTCGDHIELFLTAGTAADQASFCFTGAGCSLCIASASLLSSLLQNISLAEAQQCLSLFHSVTEQGVAADAAPEWQIFDGLRDYPVRSRCVRLPWQALARIVDQWQSAVKAAEESSL